MARRFWICVIVGFVLCVATSCQKQEQEQQVQIKKVEPKSEEFQINGIVAPSDPAKGGEYIAQLQAKLKTLQTKTGTKTQSNAGPVPYVDYIIYSYVSCQADWNVFCEGSHNLDAPPGYQICMPLHGTPQSNGNTSYGFTPTNWYNGDSQNPPRFTRYVFSIYAHGSGTVFNQTGANIYVPDVGIRIINAAADNFARYATGCELPKP